MEKLLQTPALDLAQTLDCGQCFRWNVQADGSYLGVADGKLLRISAETLPDVLADPFWADYFDMALDYGKIRGDLALLHPAMAAAGEYCPGIRVLNQDPWEALCSFILSQNNNIKRIKGIVERLCEHFGEPFSGPEGQALYAFPGPDRLACLEPEDLAPLRSGFRARYVIDAARRVAGGSVDLEALRKDELGKAREQLMTITGVGVKVADCALLYGLHRLDAFPMDVWMKRAMETLFPGKEPSFFGPYAGIAQQYIFHYIRTSGEE